MGIPFYHNKYIFITSYTIGSEAAKSEGANLGGMNCKSTGKSVAFYLGVEGLAPKKILSPEIKF